MSIDHLRTLFIFDGVSDDQLAQLAAVSDEVGFSDGDVLFHEGDPAHQWWVLLDGQVELVRRAGREDPVVIRTMERPGVWAGGFQAWDSEGNFLATGRGHGEGHMLRVPADELGRLAREWFPFGVHLIEGFFQTVRTMDSLTRQRESLIALGTLAAGLAHEINNPASATSRAVDELARVCDTLLSSLSELAERSLSADQYVELDAMRREIVAPTGPVDPLAIADSEESLLDWLDAHGVDDGWLMAPALAAAGVDPAWCDRAATVLGDDQLAPGLRWVASTLSTRALLVEMKESTSRVSALVGEVKNYSQLDRATAQVVDVTEGIESTLVMLADRLHGDIEIVRSYDPAVPHLEVSPAELNQVWTNLIVNAVDAMDGSGTLSITTRIDGDGVVVGIGDTGPGMPADVQARAFEPFYTTKDVGRGTGLGLDISRRIVVDRHHGHISIDSSPSGTTMNVRLPCPAEAEAGSGADTDPGNGKDQRQ